MSHSERDPPLELPSESPSSIKDIAAFHAKDGSVVIYDERQHTAWIESRTAVDVDEAR